MAGKSDFSVEEWDLLRQSPFMASLMVAAASPSGPLGLMKEASAAGRVIRGVAQSAGTRLVQAVAEDLDQVTSFPKRPEGADPGMTQDLALNALKRTSDLLAKKATPEEAREFKQWLTTIAQQTAEAAKEGGFLGLGGALVSDNEQIALNAIRSVLGMRAG
jgi:hypothetical protein